MSTAVLYFLAVLGAFKLVFILFRGPLIKLNARILKMLREKEKELDKKIRAIRKKASNERVQNMLLQKRFSKDKVLKNPSYRKVSMR